ncbi:uncharacterized protein AB675_2881, partial [Cyphellophora attinorum]
MATKQQTSTKPTMENKNVVGGPLHMFSKDPPTGFYRDGYCRTGPDDKGNHSVAATLTSAFLDYSASQGNNLKEHGVKPGQKWCLCAKRWKEGFDAVAKGQLKESEVPKVHLHASHESALEVVDFKTLKKYAAAGEAGENGGRQDATIKPGEGGDIQQQ